METMLASEASIWKRERIGCGKKAPIPRAKRGSLAAGEEIMRQGMRKVRSLENLETLTKPFENMETRKKSSKSPDRMFTGEDVKAWKKYMRIISVQKKEASASASSVCEEETLAQKGLAGKTLMFDTTFTMQKNDSMALLAKSDESDEMGRVEVEEDGPGTIFGVSSVCEEVTLAQKGLAGKTLMFDTTFTMEKNDSMALLAKFDESDEMGRVEVEEDGPGTIFGVLVADLLGMGGKSKAEAARRVVEAAVADEAAMDRLRAELRHEDELRRKQAEPEEEDLEMKRSDYEAWMAKEYHRQWIAVFSANYGSYDDNTRLGPMRFTDEPAPGYSAYPTDTLQVFSVKVAGIKRSLQWPIDVFGIIAARDCIDNNRNIIFSRTRDRCQTLTTEDRYLELSGPTRAVVWEDIVSIEAKLTVKGATESEDKDLSFLAVPLLTGDTGYSNLFCCYKTSKLSTLEFTLGHIVSSVEATIFVRIIDGSWLDNFHGQFSAFTTGCRNRNFRSTDHKKIILHDSVGEKFHVSGDGEIDISRRVVSVEDSGDLKVCVKSWEASECGKKVMKDEWVFKPKEDKRSHGFLDVGFCKMEVTVAWSLISYHPVPLNV